MARKYNKEKTIRELESLLDEIHKGELIIKSRFEYEELKNPRRIVAASFPVYIQKVDNVRWELQKTINLLKIMQYKK